MGYIKDEKVQIFRFHQLGTNTCNGDEILIHFRTHQLV